MLSSLIGQPYAVEVLRNYLRDGHISGSFLFVGPPQVGKATAALEFAKSMLCEAPQANGDSCDSCVSCRTIVGGRHPDIRSVQPAGPSRILRIPQIWPREGVRDFPPESALLHDLQFAPVRGKRRVFILEEADTLNDDTANSLLKVLEEPPSYATFILTAPNPSAVLPTIFSRCQTVRFQTVPTDLIVHALTSRQLADESTAKFLATFAQGRIGAAFGMAADDGLRAARGAALIAAEQLSSSRTTIQALKLADDLRKAGTKLGSARSDSGAESGDTSARQSAVAVLEILAYWYRDLLTLNAGADSSHVINADYKQTLDSISKLYDEPRLAKALELILAIRHCVERNANAQISFEALALQLISLRATPTAARTR